MKTLKIISLSLFFSLFIFSNAFSQMSNNKNLKEVKFETSAKCGSCKTAIEEAVNKTDGVKSAYLCLDSKVVTVKYDSEKTNEKELAKSIKDAGYKAKVVKSDCGTKAVKKKSDCGSKKAKIECETIEKSDCGG